MKRVFNWVTLCAALFPFALAVARCIGQGSVADALSVFQTIKFDPFVTLVNSAFTAVSWTCPQTVVYAFSWSLAVFLVRLMYELVTFLPALCFDAFTKRGEKE